MVGVKRRRARAMKREEAEGVVGAMQNMLAVQQHLAAAVDRLLVAVAAADVRIADLERQLRDAAAPPLIRPHEMAAE